jgi:outer membrane protein TolC
MRPSRFLFASSLVFAFAVASPARAQQPHPQPLMTQPLQPTPINDNVTLPPPPAVDDPDLKPLPPAQLSVSSWDDISKYLRAKSADLRVALDEVGRAEAQRRSALAGVLGSIVGSASYTHQFLEVSQFGATDSGSASLTASLPIIAPRAWNAIHMADVNIDVMNASLEDIKRTIATTVANDALTVLTDERIADLNRVGLRQALEEVELAKRKTSLGAGTGLDIVRAQQNAETARTTLVTGDETARQAREAFGLAIGVDKDVSVSGDVSFDSITKFLLTQCKSAPSVDERTDVVLAREHLHYSRVNTWDIKTQFFPTVGVSSTLSTTTVNNALTPTNTWNFVASLSWNIWDGGTRYGQLRDANLQVLEAQDRLDAARRSATIQIVQADRGVKVAEDTRAVSQRARDLAAEVDRLTRAGFMTGLYTSLDLVTSSATLRQAEINLALADFGLVKAKILAVLALATCPL